MKEYFGVTLEIQAIFLAVKFIELATGLFEMSWLMTFLPLEIFVLMFIGLLVLFTYLSKKNEFVEYDFKMWLKDLKEEIREFIDTFCN